MSKFLIMAVAVNFLLVLTILLAYLSPFVSPVRFWPISVVGLVFPWLLSLNLLFVLFWLFQSKWWYALISFAVILLGWDQVRSIVGFHVPKLTNPEVTSIRVSTFNCHGLKDRNRKDQYILPEELVGLFRKEDPDVLFIQEFHPRRRKEEPYISFLTQHSELKYFFWEKRHGLAIFSRYPMKNKTSRYFGNTSNGFQYVDLNVDGRQVRAFNIHLQSNALTGLAGRVAKDWKLKDRNTWRNVKGMISLYRKAARMRAEQATIIGAERAASPHPVILAGDLNDVPQSYAYQQLSQGVKDTFKERGSGLGWTYTGNIPGLRIDYIFIDTSFQTYDIKTEKIDFSDHRQINSTILIK